MREGPLELSPIPGVGELATDEERAGTIILRGLRELAVTTPCSRRTPGPTKAVGIRRRESAVRPKQSTSRWSGVAFTCALAIDWGDRSDRDDFLGITEVELPAIRGQKGLTSNLSLAR